MQINVSDELLSELDSRVEALARAQPETTRASLVRRFIRDGLRRLASRRSS